MNKFPINLVGNVVQGIVTIEHSSRMLEICSISMVILEMLIKYLFVSCSVVQTKIL